MTSLASFCSIQAPYARSGVRDEVIAVHFPWNLSESAEAPPCPKPLLKLSLRVALAPKARTEDGAQGKAIIFGLKTLKVVGQANAAPDTDCILYDPGFKAAGRVLGMIDLIFAVADGQGMIDNYLEDKSEVLAIDSRSLQVKSHWPIASMAVALWLSPLKVKTLCTGRSTGTNRHGPRTQASVRSSANTVAYDQNTGRIFVDTAKFGRAPQASEQRPHAQPEPIPGTFQLLVVIYPIPMISIAWFAPSKSPDCCYYLEGGGKGCREPTREGSGADFSDYGFTNSGSMAFSTAC